ncbi:MAG: glycosyltransferase family 2 protein [Lacibacter sp.]
MKPFLSIISPVYRAEKIIEDLIFEIKEGIKDITEDFEIILVEDGSPDKSWLIIEEQCHIDSRIKGIKLSRNFGQHYAITAGLDYVQGEWVVVIDCDLQDNPSEIVNLYRKTREGYKIVLARRAIRNDSYYKRMSSKLFYITLSFLTGVRQDPSIANFGIYHKDVIKAIQQMREPFRNFAAIVKWVGFPAATIDVMHSRRAEGKSTYSFKKMIKLAIDTILAYSNKPLYYIIGFGFFVSCLAFISSLVVIIRYFNGSIKVMGYTSLILSNWIIGGLLMMFLGIVGLYTGKIFEGIKNRPIYIVNETKNL